MEQLQSLPGMKWVMRHPRLSAWFVLAAGMIILLIIEAGDAGLLPTNWIALIIATILVAGLCVWIVSWDDNNETGSTDNPPEPPTNVNSETTTET